MESDLRGDRLLERRHRPQRAGRRAEHERLLERFEPEVTSVDADDDTVEDFHASQASTAPLEPHRGQR